jgi:DNA recombination protein RmuC
MMTEIFTYLLIAVIFALIGLFIGKLLSKLNFEKENTTI